MCDPGKTHSAHLPLCSCHTECMLAAWTDSTGEGAATSAPLGPISFSFLQFSGKIWPNNGLAPAPLGLTSLHLGNLGSPLDRIYLTVIAVNRLAELAKFLLLCVKRFHESIVKLSMDLDLLPFPQAKFHCWNSCPDFDALCVHLAPSNPPHTRKCTAAGAGGAGRRDKTPWELWSPTFAGWANAGASSTTHRYVTGNI